MTRLDGRRPDELRPVSLAPGFLRYAEGSALIALGETRVICAASVEATVPPFLRDMGQGWVTAEYGMLPRSTRIRTPRESATGKTGGRTHEIQRLVGRSLRAVTDLQRLGERTIWLDCDVLQADGGTRTAAITGAFIALVEALVGLRENGLLAGVPVRDFVAATSAGIVEGTALLDLNYAEDSTAGVDLNVVMTGAGRIVEVQGTAEERPFTREGLDQLLDLAGAGIAQLIAVQRRALQERFGSADLAKLTQRQIVT